MTDRSAGVTGIFFAGSDADIDAIIEALNSLGFNVAIVIVDEVKH